MQHRLVRILEVAGLAATLLLAATPGWTQQVTPGEEHGLGLLGADTPQFLKTLEADPYRAPAEPACASIPQEIADIDKVLGPDVDAHVATKQTAGEFLGGAVRGLLPYGGVVRVITGAGRRDRALIKAAMAGYARRGYLRGLEQNLQCAPAGARVPEASPASATAPASPSAAAPPPAGSDPRR